MVKKNKIQFAPIDNIQIVGVSTSLMDYKLAWHLNDRLKLNLVRHGNIEMENDMEIKSVYSFYYCNAGENSNTYNLVSLIQDGIPWMKVKPRTDFLLIIRNAITVEKLKDCIESIRQIKQINHAYLLDVNKIKGIMEVIDMVEMHEIDVLKEMAERIDPRKRMEVLRKSFEKDPLKKERP